MRFALCLLLVSCSSFVELDKANNDDTHASKKISHHQMSLEFDKDQKHLGNENEKKLNDLSEKIIKTSQPIKKITIFSNPNDFEFAPKETLINYDRAYNTKRFLERDLHSHETIVITDKEQSPLEHNKKTDILILIEYL